MKNSNKKNTDKFSAEELLLSSTGILKLPEKDDLDKVFWAERRPDLESKTVIDAVLEERN